MNLAINNIVVMNNMEDKLDLKELQRRKKHRFVLSLNDEDKDLFMKKLSEEHKTAQRFLYDKVFKSEVVDTRDYLELSYQIRKLGVILNQFIRLIYQGETIQDDKIIKVLEEVKKTLDNFKPNTTE